ncbi:hypothetical protein RF11_06522 [Thelohanellus kitauei]|uniref:ISXO2-like transposase domain-containing protein n=1 Tax=Thelohanellus kitauei TaxID=669202 RepID=A0A0C2MIW9_THEKT|nr:hypothetical protein RF11_06522 [Thelohanellus kitauei]
MDDEWFHYNDTDVGYEINTKINGSGHNSHFSINDQSERKLFLVEVPDRTANTLLSIISTHVLPGSTIITDCFRSYHNLGHLYNHLTVNHSETFRDPITGACTNTVEGTCHALKLKIAPRNRKNSVDEEGNIIESTIDDFLAEFQWRRRHQDDL